MATVDSTQQQPIARIVDFAAGDSIYQLKDGVSSSAIHDQLSARLGQLHAMLVITYGEGQESFDNWSNEIKNYYMWSAAMIAKECKELAELI